MYWAQMSLSPTFSKKVSKKVSIWRGCLAWPCMGHRFYHVVIFLLAWIGAYVSPSSGVDPLEGLYHGCYKYGLNVLGVPEDFEIFYTAVECVEFCGVKGFPLAGMMIGNQCRCGGKRGSGENVYHLGRAYTCNLICDSERRRMCGGRTAVSVYRTHRDNYIGCFRDDSDRVLVPSTRESGQILNIRYCISRCRFMDYPLAGLENGRLCLCGGRPDEFDNVFRLRDAGNCNVPCFGSVREICGGVDALSLYQTRTWIFPEDYLDCFKDHSMVLVRHTKATDAIGQTIPKCKRRCENMGFPLAGLTEGTDCLCGGRPGETDNVYRLGVANNTCNMSCSGDRTQHCGGHRAVSVYLTSLPPPHYDIDECESNPCKYEGTCHESPFYDGYSCECPTGSWGTQCEIDIDECSSSPCQNGTCRNLLNKYMCVCDAGYEGVHCETDIDECISSPCQHGDCQQAINNYTCHCVAGYQGNHCEIDIDECESNPCQHDSNCTNSVNGYTCQCTAGYIGADCESEPTIAPVPTTDKHIARPTDGQSDVEEPTTPGAPDTEGSAARARRRMGGETIGMIGAAVIVLLIIALLIITVWYRSRQRKKFEDQKNLTKNEEEDPTTMNSQI